MSQIKILFFDTETTGFPPNGRIIEIGYIVSTYDTVKKTAVTVESEVLRFRPKHKIPAGASNVHGIYDKDVERCHPFHEFLGKFVILSKEVDYIVGHNVEFDMSMIELECQDFLTYKPSLRERFGFWREDTRKKLLCTMQSSTEFCNIPGGAQGLKWPKLQQLHTTLFGEEFDGAHGAMADIEATAKCFYNLVKKGIIKIASDPFNS